MLPFSPSCRLPDRIGRPCGRNRRRRGSLGGPRRKLFATPIYIDVIVWSHGPSPQRTCAPAVMRSSMSTALPPDVPRPEYPRPQFVREAWLNLSGRWQFETDRGDSGLERGLRDRDLAGEIVVPFCPESELSGIG